MITSNFPGGTKNIIRKNLNFQAGQQIKKQAKFSRKKKHHENALHNICKNMLDFPGERMPQVHVAQYLQEQVRFSRRLGKILLHCVSKESPVMSS